MAKRQGTDDDQGRIEGRRRQILEAAAAVFARHGYHRARTREIAEKAGVSEGTIYNYYATKRDLLIALIRRVTTESLPEAVADVEAADPRHWLTAVLRDRLAMLERNRELFKAVLPEMITDRELRHDYYQRVILPFVAHFLPSAEGLFDAAQLRPFNPRVVLPAVIGGVTAAFVLAEGEGLPLVRSGSREELIGELVDLFMDGLRRDDRLRDAASTEPGAAPW